MKDEDSKTNPQNVPTYTRQELENNLKLLEIHSRALSTQIAEAEEFYIKELPHGSLLRGWDNFASANLQAPNSRHKPLPEASRFFSGCVKNQGQPIEVSQTEIFKDTPTIILSKGTQQNNPGGYGGTGPVKRPAP